MSVIKQMDEKLANMIAAGEVVERPASIIKELVENSIDAKATSIAIFVTDNGLKEIKVLDNGIGMTKEDAKMAFLRHATSKISNEYDLERIKTLGFRGEALAAILSVSKVELKTRKENENAYFVEYLDSKLINEGTTSLNTGTEITIRDLFYNTPARLKYVKSEYSERAAIIETFDKLALSNPSIRFSLNIDDVLVKETYGNNDYYGLVSQIYGQSVLKDLKFFENKFSNIKIKGYLGSPSISRSRKKDIVIFVNGRYIKNYGITQSIIDGYHSFLMTNKYPLAILMIEMDPVLLDVNVHPQKLDVKFTNESLLKYHIETFIKETLTNFKHDIPQNLSMFKDKVDVDTNEKKEIYIKESLDFDRYNDELPFNDSNSTVKEEQEFILNNDSIKDSKPINNNDNEVTYEKKIPPLYYIGTLSGTYLLFQNENGMYMVDQHAAEERVNYEYYYGLIDNTKIVIKEMLLPYKLNITNNDLEFIKNHLIEFNKYGLNFDNEVRLISHPTFILDNDLDNTIEDMIKMITEGGQISLNKLLDNLAKGKSCKASIKANHAISRQEIDALIEKLRLTKNPYTCPHGRPTIIMLTYYEIERMFKRVVS